MSGLTKRELVAAMVVQGLVDVRHMVEDKLPLERQAEIYAKTAALVADALLAELAKDGAK